MSLLFEFAVGEEGVEDEEDGVEVEEMVGTAGEECECWSGGLVVLLRRLLLRLGLERLVEAARLLWCECECEVERGVVCAEEWVEWVDEDGIMARVVVGGFLIAPYNPG